jgi:hypothetical protein
MNLSLGEIQRRRGELVERARAERADLEGVLHSQGAVFWLADRGVAMIRLLVANKEILLVGALAFAVVQPRRTLRWAIRAWGLFRLVSKISRAVA